MNRLLTIICIFEIAFLHGQIVIEQSDYYKYGNEYYRTNTNQNLSSLDFAATVGPNQIWDFSNLEGSLNDTLKVIKADLTPYYSNFPSANFGLTSGNNNYFYERISDSGVTILGKVVRDDFNNANNIFSYNSEGSSFVFPLEYQDSYSFSWYYAIQYPAFFPGSDSIRNRNSSQFELSVDAWGQLTLQIGTFDVLRLKQIAYLTDTSNIYNFPGPWANDIVRKDTTVSWSFYAKSIGSSLFSFTQLLNGLSRQASWLQGYEIDETNIEKPVLSELSIYPQPSDNFLNIETKEDMDYKILDIGGKLIISGKLQKGGNSINTSSLDSGMYLIQTLDRNTNKTTVNKFIVNSNY